MRKKLKHISMLALLTVAAQGAWAQEALSLPDGSDNSSTIEAKNGKTCNVTLSGRTLYRDGDWNTLCLPFSMTAEQITESTHPLHGATIKKLLNTSNLRNGTLTLYFEEVTSIEAIEAGTPYIVKWPVALTINNDTDWDTFVNNVSEGTTYAGQIVKLNADISIGSGDMVGNKTYYFKGTFDGGGHTITCDNITDTSDQGAAPFFCIQDATIMNLKVTGRVTGGNHCAGLVGFAFGTNTIKNCWVDVDVTCSGTYCGGILGHGHSTTTTISNCLFSGSITGNGSTKVGVIYGWASDSSTGSHTIENCLANGDYTSYGTIDLMQRDGNVASQTVTNCYQNIASTGAMGTYIGNNSASQLVNSLNNPNSNWQVIDGKAVPKMNAYVEKTSPIPNPVFEGVKIANTLTYVEFSNNNNEANKCMFKGSYAPLAIDANNCNEILLLSSGNRLGYAKPNNNGTYPTLNAFRAYFHIPIVDGARAVRDVVLDFGDDETTGITETEADSSLFTHHSMLSGWHTLDGRRLDRQPTKAGLYINNGRKVIIK